jgi:phage portal protein BeeE
MALFGRRKVEERALTRQTLPAIFLPETSPATVGPYTATRIGDVFACVRCLADSAASLALIAYRRTADGRVRAGGRVQELTPPPARLVPTT